MAMDLGAVIGRVILDTTAFDAKYPVLLQRMSTLGTAAGRSAGGVRRLDTSLAGTGTAATRAAAGLDKTAVAAKRAGTSASQASAATQRQAAAANRLAEAQARVAALMNRTAGQSTRSRILALRDMAAQQRLAAAHSEAGSAAARQATATARLAEAQAAALASAKKLSGANALSSAALIANGRKMSRRFTLPIVAAGAIAIHEAAQFEQATNVYVTAAGESAKNLGVIRDGIKKVAMETGTSIDNLTEAEYVLQKAGYRGAEGIKVLDASAKGAREENAQLSDVVQAMTSIMSAYNIPASQSVQVMNALKTGAGSAKVSMEDYTRALSTALPIASANHISVDQLLGAYSQLTQAGNTAQYSTQLLSSTIRAMAAPNRVAQKAMQQFGLDVNDVTGKLGQRGLSGTMKLYIDAITKKMGPSGLVVQDAFNKQASAMEDVNIMLGKMPPAVRTLSKNYQDGKLSFKDWRDAMKALPTDQAAMAKNFATVSDRTHAFNDLLKNGDPAAQTFSAALRKMTNGAIGMNTFLQLMGNNFKGVDTRAQAVSKSLHNADHEVEGWHSTAQLASVKADQLKESLHVLAIDGGNALLPVFKRIVDGFAGLARGFMGLDSSQKKILGWSLGIVAALGPLMFIGGKLMGVGTKIAAFATMVSGSSVLAGRAIKGLGVALAGGALGYGIGSMTRHASGAAKAVGVLGSTATGALIGFGAGGPVGAAVGAGAGLLGSLAGAFSDAGDAAKAAVEPTDEYTQAILRDNEALGANTRALVTQSLQKKGAYDSALKLGINQKTLTDAMMGNEEALKKVGAAMAGFEGGNQGPSKLRLDYANLKSAVGDVNAELRVNQRAAHNLAQANTSAGKAARAQATELKRIQGLQTGVTGSLKQMNVQVATHGTSLDQSTKAGKSNLNYLGQSLGKIKSLAQAQVNAGTSTAAAAQQAKANTKALREQAIASGFGAAEVDKLIRQYKTSPKGLVTGLIGGLGKSTASAKQLGTVLSALKAGKIAGFDVDTKQGKAAIAALQARIDELNGTTAKPKITVDNALAMAGTKLTKEAMLGIANMVVDPEIKADPAQAQETITYVQAAINAIKQGQIPDLKADSTEGKRVIAALQRQLDGLKPPVNPRVNFDTATSRQKINALQALINNIKRGANPAIDANTAAGKQAIAALQAQIDALNGKTVGIGVNVNIRTHGKLPAGTKAPDLNIFGANGMILRAFANGGINKPSRESHIAQIAKRGTWRVWAEDEAGDESYIPLAPSKRARSRRIAIETVKRLGGVAMFADGGITHSGKDWIYDGTKYASKRAAENAQTSDRKSKKKKDKDKAQSAVDSAISNVGQTKASPIDLSNMSYAKVIAQIRRASDVLADQIRKGLTKSAERRARAQLRELRRDADRQLAALRVKIKTSDMAAIKTALKGTADDVRNAFDTVITDARNSGADKATIAILQSGERRLIRKQAQIAAARDRLEKMQEYNTGVKDTLGQNVDVSTAGSVTDMLNVFGDATGANNTYTSQVTALTNRVKGNATLTALVSELASKGNSAGLESLAGSSAAELAQIAKAYAGYNASLGAGGDAATRLKFGNTVSGQTASIAGMVKEQSALVSAIANVATLMARRPSLKLKINGHDITSEVVDDAQFEAALASAVKKMTAAQRAGRRP